MDTVLNVVVQSTIPYLEEIIKTRIILFQEKYLITIPFILLTVITFLYNIHVVQFYRRIFNIPNKLEQYKEK